MYLYMYTYIYIYLYHIFDKSYPREGVLEAGSWSRLGKGHGAARKRVMEPLGLRGSPESEPISLTPRIPWGGQDHG